MSLANWGHCIVKYGEVDILYGSCKGSFLNENMVISASTSSPAALNQHHLQHYQIMLRNGENVRKSPPSKKTKKTNLDFPSDSPSYRCIDL